MLVGVEAARVKVTSPFFVLFTIGTIWLLIQPAAIATDSFDNPAWIDTRALDGSLHHRPGELGRLDVGKRPRGTGVEQRAETFRIAGGHPQML